LAKTHAWDIKTDVRKGVCFYVLIAAPKPQQLELTVSPQAAATEETYSSVALIAGAGGHARGDGPFVSKLGSFGRTTSDKILGQPTAS
jgi:hypothetical protein